MNRAVSIMIGLCRVPLSPHISPASTVLPLLPQRLMFPMFPLACCGHSQRTDCNTSAYPPACRMEQFRPRKELETALDGAAALMTFLSLSYSLFLSLSFSFYFILTRTFMTAPSNKTKTPTAVQYGTSCSAHQYT